MGLKHWTYLPKDEFGALLAEARDLASVDGDPALAIEIYNHILPRGSQDSALYLERAMLYVGMEKYDKAQKDVDRAMHLGGRTCHSYGADEGEISRLQGRLKRGGYARRSASPEVGKEE